MSLRRDPLWAGLYFATPACAAGTRVCLHQDDGELSAQLKKRSPAHHLPSLHISSRSEAEAARCAHIASGLHLKNDPARTCHCSCILPRTSSCVDFIPPPGSQWGGSLSRDRQRWNEVLATVIHMSPVYGYAVIAEDPESRGRGELGCGTWYKKTRRF